MRERKLRDGLLLEWMWNNYNGWNVCSIAHDNKCAYTVVVDNANLCLNYTF